MNKLEMMQDMLNLQDQMNTKVLGPDWRLNEKAKWLRAAWVEGAELMEHLTFKWWKKQTPDIEQAQIELVDIWHFLLSAAIKSEYLTAEDLLDSFGPASFKYLGAEVQTKSDLELIELFVLSVLEGGEYVDYYSVFALLCARLDLSYEELYKQYIGKNVLNFFRQDNGYKEGTYIKIWGSEEDNVYLARILKEIPEDCEDVSEYIYAQLGQTYDKFVL